MDFLEGKEIWVSPYRLRSKGFLNSLSARREFEGVLIRVGEGYACIHPWPELGDPPIEKCLEDLSGRRFWPIVRRALRCAEYDHTARCAEESLFEEMLVPRSHATLVDRTPQELETALEAGFDKVKMKAGRDLAHETEFFFQMQVAYPHLTWRLDFNETMEPALAGEWLAALSSERKRAIEFLEDICPFSDNVWMEIWKKHGIRLAVDREAAPHRKAAQVMVIKPAIDEPFPLAEAAAMNGQYVVMTSYMDHPLGQAFAAWEAARLELIFPGLVKTCGLQTHHLFDRNEFVEGLGEWKPEFSIPPGTGLGFDEELAALPWRKLKQ